MKNIILGFGIISLLLNCTSETAKPVTKEVTKKEIVANTIYKYKYQSPTDSIKHFKEFEGKVMLIVNTATECGLTPQFEGLEKLHTTYSEKGLVVLGFPCNQFGGQEPLTNEEMVETCRINHGVTFELTKKIEVNGANENELYTFLKSEQNIGEKNDIRWNFEKFLVNRKGEVVKRFSPKLTPEEINAEIKGLL
ncbi:glutathione peroxidase [Flavobacteriales bacterium]|nr:glutathione peroxidase [Flavobacteriales bacterium]